MRDLAYTLMAQYAVEGKPELVKENAREAVVLDMAKMVVEDETFFNSVAELHGLTDEEDGK